MKVITDSSMALFNVIKFPFKKIYNIDQFKDPFGIQNHQINDKNYFTMVSDIPDRRLEIEFGKIMCFFL